MYWPVNVRLFISRHRNSSQRNATQNAPHYMVNAKYIVQCFCLHLLQIDCAILLFRSMAGPCTKSITFSLLLIMIGHFPSILWAVVADVVIAIVGDWCLVCAFASILFSRHKSYSFPFIRCFTVSFFVSFSLVHRQSIRSKSNNFSL